MFFKVGMYLIIKTLSWNVNALSFLLEAMCLIAYQDPVVDSTVHYPMIIQNHTWAREDRYAIFRRVLNLISQE